MFRIYPKQNRVVIETDELEVKALLEFKRTVTQYNPMTKGWVDRTTIDKLYQNTRSYDKGDHFVFELRLGWISYLLLVFKDKLSVEDYNCLTSMLLSPYYRTVPFQNLRPQQNEDVLFILKYKRAIVQTNTSYGKLNCRVIQ